MKLTGIEIRNFRSIGNASVKLNPLDKCNILIGKNNAGKSNALKAIQALPSICQRGQFPFTDLDLYRRSNQNPVSFTLFFESSNSSGDDRIVSLTRAETVYFSFFCKRGQKERIELEVTDCTLAHMTNLQYANEALSGLVGREFGVPSKSDAIRGAFLEYGPQIFYQFYARCIPSVYVIPAFRQIRPGDTYSFNGEDLIRVLGRFQHPNYGSEQENDRRKFEQIQDCIRRLLHLPQAKLEVTHDSTTITLTNDDLRLPLDSYGTGVHELAILLTAVLSIDNAICCIEEPEIHLHPTLQREFIEFITKETTNQYFVSTHSPTLINAHVAMPVEVRSRIQVFHLRLEDGSTRGDPVLSDVHCLDILDDLGVKASDILQANCVLWVEGPSDRIYLNKWLSLVAPDLVEGLHYSIMFYGGRLLSHLSADRNDVPEGLIDLLRINQHSMVMMDSDKCDAEAPINSTKQRIMDECTNSGSLCWLTCGREVENYLPARIVESGCRELAGAQIKFSIRPYEKFDDLLDQELENAGAKRINYSGDKVRYARLFVKYFEETDITEELAEMLSRVVAEIRHWNTC